MQHYFFIKVNSKYERINLCDIIYVEGLRNYVKIVTGTRHYVVLNTLKKIEELLPADLFCRVHRSYMVAIGKIASFDILSSINIFFSDKLNTTAFMNVCSFT